ncbi:uncharacterized protein MKK02DRAFT_37881 [Dioszegia hungarica]|uniref:Uncharacterized protein n=1 Tax=Dioszegia hungarica TaxID=4972 RepID=A0AA38LT26_9TREE|nr:uncharacterized protein MKK02DRAFT_37881 [Dioszegia hungarica]KAI9634350.1 hypothetical protein MKK02DRAFT_37881 [Dioszegia hungarica]
MNVSAGQSSSNTFPTPTATGLTDHLTPPFGSDISPFYSEVDEFTRCFESDADAVWDAESDTDSESTIGPESPTRTAEPLPAVEVYEADQEQEDVYPFRTQRILEWLSPAKTDKELPPGPLLPTAAPAVVHADNRLAPLGIPRIVITPPDSPHAEEHLPPPTYHADASRLTVNTYRLPIKAEYNPADTKIGLQLSVLSKLLQPNERQHRAPIKDIKSFIRGRTEARVAAKGAETKASEAGA